MTEMHVLSKQHRPTPQNLSWLNTELQAILKWPANLYTASSLWLPFTGPQYLNTPACMYLRTSAPATHLDCSPWVMCLASQLVSPGCHGKTPQPGRLRQNCMASQFLGLKVPAQSAGWLVLREVFWLAVTYLVAVSFPLCVPGMFRWETAQHIWTGLIPSSSHP